MRSICAFVVVVACACGGSPRSPESLLESVRTYHEGIRWSRIPIAASRVPADERADFITEWDKLADDLRITDYELLQVAQGDETSRVEVKYTWYLDSRLVVHETRATEDWERQGKVWIRVAERRLRGEKMPGLAEPETDPETDAASADSPDDSVEARGD
jgi:hypothetical protein